MGRHNKFISLVVCVVVASAVPFVASFRQAQTVEAAPQVVPAAAGVVTGVVYEDRAVNGILDAGDPRLAGVTVSAYDSSGSNVGTTASGADGTYSLAVASSATADLRVEFTTPPGYMPSFAGSGNGTSVQFVELGDTGVNYGVHQPAAFCANTGASMSLVAACIRPGTASGSASSQSSLSTMGWSTRQPTTVMTFGRTGAIWGVATDMERGTMWTSAVVRRHAGLGSGGLGGLYVMRQGGSGELTASFDLAAAPYNLPFAASPSDFTDANRGIVDSSLLSLDLPGYAGVGRAGIGDIDIDGQNTFLYVTNLHTRQIHRFALGGSTSAPELGQLTTFDLPAGTCPGTTARPWALNADARPGRVLVGVVCTGEEQPFSATSNASDGFILELNPTNASWSTVTPVDFGYVRGNERCTTAASLTDSNAYKCESHQWHHWTDDFAAIRAATAANPPQIEMLPDGSTELFWYSQPMIVDIEQLADGALIVGVSDRFNYQLGAVNVAPDETAANLNFPNRAYTTARVTGDLLLLCSGASAYVQDSDGSCVGSTTTYTAASRTSAVAGLASTSPYREFFDDNVGGTFQGAHQEIIIGGLAVYPDSGTQLIAVTAMDADNNLGTNGVRWLNTADGSMNGAGARLTQGSANSFEKSVSMGDLELLCDAAPLQIGNRLWYDMNRNGVQDAGEPPVVGVDVNLYNNSGTLVGTAITDANGTYYFSSNVSEAANGGASPDHIGGGLAAHRTFQLRLGVRNGFAAYLGGSSAPLDFNTWEWTAPGGTSVASPNDTAIDSSTADLVEIFAGLRWARLNIGPLATGEVNHTFDFGIHPKSSAVVTVGDLVWHDLDRDGRQDVGEPGLAGAVLTLTDPGGNPVNDILGRPVSAVTTSADGLYSFQDLPEGDYKVTITYPPGYSATKPGVGADRSADSSTDSVTTDNWLLGGESDLTLDFGVVQAVEVGNRVWVDTDADGVQDGGEPGIAGAVLTITDVNGDPVIDVFGDPVQPVTTSATGLYRFSNLPSGTYVVSITYPAGHGPTRVGQGSDSTADSSGRVAVSSALVAGDPTRNSDLTLDFGVIATATPPVAVGNFVWVDTDADGLQDVGEAGLAGATLSVTTMNGAAVVDQFGTPVAPIVTDSTGRYLFDGLPPGQYRVEIQYPAGYVATTAESGANRGVDSSTDVATSVVLPAGSVDLTLDFGVVVAPASQPAAPASPPPALPSGIADLVVQPANPVSPPSSVPPSSVPPSTVPPSTVPPSTVPASTVPSSPAPDEGAQDGAGSSVSGPPVLGSVPSQVREGYPGTFVGGSGAGIGADDTPVWVGSDLAPSGIGVNVGGFVWFDQGADGRQDLTETGFVGVELRIETVDGEPALDVDGNPVGPTTTDATGHFLFPRLQPGAYVVVVAGVPGHQPTAKGVGSRLGDSSSRFATSVTMDADGSFDLALDFGFVPQQKLPATGLAPGSLPAVALIVIAAGLCLVPARRTRRP